MSQPASDMLYTTMGRTGLIVSRLSFGSWVTFKAQVETEKAYELMAAAYKAGINLFDNAEVYAQGESERVMGEAIAMGVEKGTWTREDLVITTKIFFGTKPGHNTRGLSRKHIVEGLRASLQRLGLAYVDMVFCHRPDPVTPIEETVRAMNWLIEQGLAFYWGTSEWSAAEITEAIAVADRLGLIRPAFEQPEYNLFARQRVEVEYAPLYRSAGMGLTTWSPLASGILTGKYAGATSGKPLPAGSRFTVEAYDWLRKAKMEGDDAWQFEAADALAPIAAELGCTPAQLSLAWCLTNPHVSTVILGATRVEQLEENLGSLKVLPKLTPEVIKRVEDAIGPRGAPKLGKVEAQVSGARGVSAIHGLDLGRTRL